MSALGALNVYLKCSVCQLVHLFLFLLLRQRVSMILADASLEYLACDLGGSLHELVLDRCIHVTDVGIGHIAAMTSIQRLFLRFARDSRVC